MTQKLNVHFLNRGYDTDYGVKTVDVVSNSICEFTTKPQATIRSPFGLSTDTLVAEYSGKEWVCDLD
jgi:hypothetical protein